MLANMCIRATHVPLDLEWPRACPDAVLRSFDLFAILTWPATERDILDKLDKHPEQFHLGSARILSLTRTSKTLIEQGLR